jgi:hypothetical protein
MDTLVVSSVYCSVVASVVATATTATTATIPFATMTPVILPTTTRPTTTIRVVVIVHPPTTATATPFLHNQRVQRAVDNAHHACARLARGLARIRDDVNTRQRKNQN